MAKRKPIKPKPVIRRTSLSGVKVNWQAECIRLLQRVYPARWEAELWNIQLRYLLKQTKEKGKL